FSLDTSFMLEPQTHIKPIKPDALGRAVIKIRVRPVAVVTDLRAQDEDVVEIMADADGMTGEVAAGALAIARFIAVPLVAETQVVFPGKGEGCVVEHAVALG